MPAFDLISAACIVSPSENAGAQGGGARITRVEAGIEMQHTRRQILDCIKLKGGMSVDQLGRELQVMPVTIRAHINVLERGKLVKRREMRTGRAGRPRIVYSLTDAAEDLFPKDYDHLAASLISNMRDLYGNDSVKEVLKRVGVEMARSNADEVKSEDLGERIKGATRVMNKIGSLATWERDRNGYSVTAHNCPYLHVANEFADICDMEVAFLKEVLDREVMLECSVVGGAHNCRFFVEEG